MAPISGMSRPSSSTSADTRLPMMRVENLEEDVEDDEDPDETGQRADALRRKLTGIAVEQALHGAGHAVPAVAVGAIGEQTDATARPTRR